MGHNICETTIQCREEVLYREGVITTTRIRKGCDMGRNSRVAMVAGLIC